MKRKKIDELWSHVHWLGLLAETQSYTAAAQRLGVSKAAMSHRITELEAAAGVALVRRTTRSVRLTEAGQRLVDATRTCFAAIEEGYASVQDLAEQPGGVVVLTMPVALGRQQIVPRLPAWLEAHPKVRIEVDLSDQLRSLAQDGYDLAIRHVDTVPDTHVAWPLCDTETVLAATPDYVRRIGVPASPRELGGHNCLHYPRGGATPTWSFEATRGRRERISVPVLGNCSANNSEVLRELALSGSGIALLPDFSARQELADGRLVRVLPQWRSVGAFGERIYAMRPYSAHVPRSVQSLVAFLKKSLAGGFRP